LTEEEVQFCRRNRIALAYDPMQIGWLPATVDDDFGVSPQSAPKKRARNQSAIAHKPQIKAPQPQYDLRAWEPSDPEQYRALLDDLQIWAHLPEPYPDPLTDEVIAALIELSNSSNHHSVFAVLRYNRIIGQVRLLYDVDDANPGVAEISYWLGRAFWGKGIGSDLVSLFSRRCFADNPGITTLIARVQRDNEASATVLRRAGYDLRSKDTENYAWRIYAKARWNLKTARLIRAVSSILSYADQ
jgi:RimJ/RimL family protein N-acetyltransferase